MSAIPLTGRETTDITKVIANLYQFRNGDTRGRYRLIEMADVDAILTNVQMDGPATDVAWDIIRRLANYGNLPHQPLYHALGALLSYILTISDLPQDHAQIIARLIVKYSLVSDPSYLAELRSTYQIDEAVAREPSSEVVAPVAPPIFDVTPTFEPSSKAADTLERIINSRDNFLDIALLVGGVHASHAVCLIEVPLGTAKGTGFLIGLDLLLTNQHVLKSKEWLNGAAAHFNFRKDTNGAAPGGQRYTFDPNFYVSSPPEELDYALVRLTQQPLQHLVKPASQQALDTDPPVAALSSPMFTGWHRGYLVLSEDLIREGERVNIIQHPRGEPMKIVLTQNRVVEDMTATRVQYLVDTDEGSSGSPVFNQKWEVVALHHSGAPYPPVPPYPPQAALKNVFHVNEGIPMRAILADLRKKGVANLLPEK